MRLEWDSLVSWAGPTMAALSSARKLASRGRFWFRDVFRVGSSFTGDQTGATSGGHVLHPEGRVFPQQGDTGDFCTFWVSPGSCMVSAS